MNATEVYVWKSGKRPGWGYDICTLRPKLLIESMAIFRSERTARAAMVRTAKRLGITIDGKIHDWRN
ncbi:MAG: hypothetical protein JRE40_04180 [Deltaproteobacteria bacterium]|nr:hypothetical protein [Deltaproteobacteria bacterium]